MKKHQQEAFNRRLNAALANTHKTKALKFFANLYEPSVGFDTWRQFLMHNASGPDGYISKDIYRQQLRGLREAVVSYRLAASHRFNLYQWVREDQRKK